MNKINGSTGAAAPALKNNGATAPTYGKFLNLEAAKSPPTNTRKLPLEFAEEGSSRNVKYGPIQVVVNKRKSRKASKKSRKASKKSRKASKKSRKDSKKSRKARK